MAEQEAPKSEVEVRTVDLEGEGFWPKYRQIIQMKELFLNPMSATKDDLDSAFEFLIEHITKPSIRKEKIALLNKLDAEHFVGLFEKIGGGAQTAVPPSSGEASASSSE